MQASIPKPPRALPIVDGIKLSMMNCPQVIFAPAKMAQGTKNRFARQCSYWQMTYVEMHNQMVTNLDATSSAACAVHTARPISQPPRMPRTNTCMKVKSKTLCLAMWIAAGTAGSAATLARNAMVISPIALPQYAMTRFFIILEKRASRLAESVPSRRRDVAITLTLGVKPWPPAMVVRKMLSGKPKAPKRNLCRPGGSRDPTLPPTVAHSTPPKPM
mmetsp:Transcript_77730/g.200116  ORF Transcript_77730/g.200116 Transcript_77730/m.200116 type:complete len:217 (+) Transcript_77730:486-1136(+)